ncbi:ATP-binding cassette domain-containing protein [Paenactinomyces guangxiensis]|uniref:ATP-binding cassette domain-containing protein n=1 Tax=Paenactinomyces guangxiensis TaxID=1490290 RepID=A0A7W1WRU4_9BACL|nr:ATP-binding cassette domain-containing protein [Paenactinomyces guangxiensis]MBA4494880.1 ATP-binding cassette domain-containing protein [Paenactinomyces guangxiensis]MBH8591963.1 ATP-binding cassette domain-containing protein [Paenactinomyces guangxiensis]
MRIDWSHVSKIYEPQESIRGYYQKRTRHMGLLDFSASVRRGITVILGPEGSGKTTLLRLTGTLMVPDDGRITFQDSNGEGYVWSKGSVITSGISSLGDLKEKIGYIPHTKKLDHDITVELSLLHLAQLRRVPNPKKRSAEMITKWGLGAYRRTPLHELSGGSLKRYLLAQSLIVSPKIWILDEPTKGMDELGKRLLWQELIDQPADRITLIATTDDMELAECADDLMLLESGSCRRLGRKKWLTASVPEGTVSAWYKAMQAFSKLRSSQR